ncbi:uncharacterized protein BYT42DRAFT_589520 [Radiomyces spectabilis]|uniref:uncharacterized protein n=1 Tax=Radiomyces spectabilis TaxID=64574 RepID=UPI0022212691|nr:uncharacterized protein BYT42DRAFT_589520 [Radiomyces spectabilis]KAI8365318.1 hypothetical protein BYT42DRAFT_589520 [Radiomyces spectabilis]
MQTRWTPQPSMTMMKTEDTPRLIEMNPSRGTQGTVITLVIQSLPIHHISDIKIAFNDLVLDTKQMQAQGITSLVATVPPLIQINTSSTVVPISICLLNRDTVIEAWPMGEFTYLVSNNSGTNDFHPTPEENYFLNSPSVCESTYVSPVGVPYRGQHDSFTRGTDYYQSEQGPFDRSAATDYSSSFGGVAAPDPGFTQMVSADFQSNPAQRSTYPIRYDTSQRPGSYIPPSSVGSYQPYSRLVSRSSLRIEGDIDSMMANWSPEEWSQRRRLVQFWRESFAKGIRCSFHPATPTGEKTIGTHNDGHRNGPSIIVSCIYWAERNDWFITSVDCLHLLESLLNIRFSVEEKNRIRRNLEGFRPITVSKCKSDCTDFFKLIMNFPSPKPRNIEKDVKVFHWKALPYALKKIVAKYTAFASPTLQEKHTVITQTPPRQSETPQTIPMSQQAPSPPSSQQVYSSQYLYPTSMSPISRIPSESSSSSGSSPYTVSNDHLHQSYGAAASSAYTSPPSKIHVQRDPDNESYAQSFPSFVDPMPQIKSLEEDYHRRIAQQMMANMR